MVVLAVILVACDGRDELPDWALEQAPSMDDELQQDDSHDDDQDPPNWALEQPSSVNDEPQKDDSDLHYSPGSDSYMTVSELVQSFYDREGDFAGFEDEPDIRLLPNILDLQPRITDVESLQRAYNESPDFAARFDRRLEVLDLPLDWDRMRVGGVGLFYYRFGQVPSTEFNHALTRLLELEIFPSGINVDIYSGVSSRIGHTRVAPSGSSSTVSTEEITGDAGGAMLSVDVYLWPDDPNGDTQRIGIVDVTGSFIIS